MLTKRINFVFTNIKVIVLCILRSMATLTVHLIKMQSEIDKHPNMFFSFMYKQRSNGGCVTSGGLSVNAVSV